MSHAGLRCPGCGSSNVVEDSLYAQAQLVCVDCGSVVSEGFLASDPVGGSDVSYSRTTAVDRYPCTNLIKGVQRVKAICQVLRVNKQIEELSTTYFNQAYQHESFIKVSLEKKEVLGGCCVIVSCRLHNWPVTMGTISSVLEANPMMVGAVYQEMVQALGIQAPIVNITDIIEAQVQEYKLSSPHVPEQYAETSKDLTKRAVALVELAADTWIVTGRKPVPLIMAAIYLAWQSLRPSQHRLKFSLDKFCQIANVDKRKPALKRVIEIKEVLWKLGREIPWVSEAVTPNNVVVQVEDILKHRHALLRRALRTHEDALLAECPASCEASPSRVSEPVEQNANASSLDRCEPNTARAQPPGDGKDQRCTAPEMHRDAEGSRDPSANRGKRALFAPPCVTHPKRKRAAPPELKVVTGDEEISDSEIDSYIRTPREAREFAQAQNILSSSQSEKS